MTTEAATTTAAATTEPAKTEAPKQAATEPATPPAKQFDEEAFEERVTSKAEEIAEEKIKRAFRTLAGVDDSKEPKVNPRVREFVDDPEGVLEEVEARAVARTRKEINDERTLAMAAGPILQKYPDLQNHLDYADAKITANLKAGMNIKEATEKGLEEAAKKLNLKSVDEVEQDARVRDATLPFGGSHQGSSGKKANSFDPNKSATNYITALKAKHKSFKVRTT